MTPTLYASLRLAQSRELTLAAHCLAGGDRHGAEEHLALAAELRRQRRTIRG